MAQVIGMQAELPLLNESIGPDLIAVNDGLTDEENDNPDNKNASRTDLQDPYESFMARHLQQYGYFTGRNASFRNKFEGLDTWRKNYDLRLSGTQNLSVDEHQKNMEHCHPHKNPQLDPGFGQLFAEGQLPDELLSRTTQLVFHYQAGKKIPKLREPRNLYALTKEPGPQQATRWPSHMQVICPPIHFVDYTPAVPDPFYVPTGREPTFSVRGSPNGEIVYLNDPGKDVYFMRSRVAGCRMAQRNISLTPRESVDEGNFTLEFESRFESGNLLKAVKINEFDYELTLRPDLYTEKHTQWYFFRVRNMVPNEEYRLTIVNLMKPSSLYNSGMKPLFYSEIEARKHKIGWTRAGSDIRYYRNNLSAVSGQNFYSLTWTIRFPHKDDTCYFAHCYPYTYTDLQEYLLKLANDPIRSKFCKQRVLCRTLAGNLVYMITVTSPSRNPEIARAKKAVVITARVHPGETNSSWMMKGFLDFLSGNSPDAKLLRDNFIFKIAPMLNPDGVIVGNYRCSLAGRDLNRNYKSVLKDSFPSVWHVKMMVKRLNMEREVAMYCDLHGHSRKNNIFIYGCENKRNPKRKLRERVFPLMLSKNANTKFTYDSCKFKVQKSKQGTGRVVMWCMGIMNSYTMEATFGGASLGSRKGTHFSTRDLEEMGHNFCDTLLDYCDPDSSKVTACFQEIQQRLRNRILKKMQSRNLPGSISDVNIDDFSSEYESDTSGSDSSCDDGLPVHLLAIAPKLRKKRRLKTRRDRNKQTVKKETITPSVPAEEPKPAPMPSYGARPQAEKPPKPTRISQTTECRRKEDVPAISMGTASHKAALQNVEKATKKVSGKTYIYGKSFRAQDDEPPRASKTLVQFAPDLDERQQKHPRPPWYRETEKGSRGALTREAQASPHYTGKKSGDHGESDEEIDFKTAPQPADRADLCVETCCVVDSAGDSSCQLVKTRANSCAEKVADFSRPVAKMASEVVDFTSGVCVSTSILKIPSRVKVVEKVSAGEWIPTAERKCDYKSNIVKQKQALSSDETTALKLVTPNPTFQRPTTKFHQQKKRNVAAAEKFKKFDRSQKQPSPESQTSSETESFLSCSKRLSQNLPAIKPVEPCRARQKTCSNMFEKRGTTSKLASGNQSADSSTARPCGQIKLPLTPSKFTINPALKAEQEIMKQLKKTYKLLDFPQFEASCVCFHLPVACHLCRR